MERRSPVRDATHVDLQVAVVSQQPLLHLDQIHGSALQSQESHAPLEDVPGVVTVLSGLLRRTAWVMTKNMAAVNQSTDTKESEATSQQTNH